MMKKFFKKNRVSKITTVLVIAAVLFLNVSPLSAKTLKEAVKTASKGGNSKVISARTVNKGNKRTHEVRVLTNKGKVKTMRYPSNRKSNPSKAPKQNKAEGSRR